jgi:enolase
MKQGIRIQKVLAREVLDSRGFPTVEAEIYAESVNGAEQVVRARAIVPSGASTGEYEAIELRDGDKKRFLGKGTLKAVSHIREKIAPAMVGRDFFRQTLLDDLLKELDGTENKSNLGANAILAVSIAFARVQAKMQGVSDYRIIAGLVEGKGVTLPTPMMNLINGGQHADNELDVQEFMIVPAGFDRFSDALRAGTEVFHHLKKILKAKGLSTAVGDEGGFAPSFFGPHPHEQTLAALIQAIEEAGYKPGKEIFLALDSAASEFCDRTGDHQFVYRMEGKTFSSEEMVNLYSKWVSAYPIISIEDGLDENDWKGWKALTEELGKRCQLVGDDLFVTNPLFLKKGIEQGVGNSILIKLNQIGSVTETLETMKMAEQAGYASIVSHRSGETEDTFIADLAVGTDCGQIKTGSASRTDRMAKYNQLLRIEEELGADARFAGKGAFRFAKEKIY